MESLPSYKDLKNKYPLLPSQNEFIEKSRNTVRSILNGSDSRLLLIVGPCSIHDLSSARDFASRLIDLAKEVSSEFFTIMRVYCEKPRTALGWKGFLYDPFLDGSYKMQQGIEWSRQLFLELAALEVPVATECLDPFTIPYYQDLITWGCIGARTTSSQIHRTLASGLPFPVGFKNETSGNVLAAICGLSIASQSQICLFLRENSKLSTIRTKGNPDVHIVLRGGELEPNYGSDTVSATLNLLKQSNFDQRLLIDCSHQNSRKKHDIQPEVFRSVIDQVVEGNKHIRGLMLESHIYEGNQELTEDPSFLRYGVSITDSCLDWESTARLVKWGARHIAQHTSSHLLSNKEEQKTLISNKE